MKIYNDYKDIINEYYHIVDVTDAGIEYFHTTLMYGRILSKLVINFISLDEGNIKTFVERNLERNSLTQFSHKLLTPNMPEKIRDLPNDNFKWPLIPVMDFFVIPIIQKYLAENNRNIFILEDSESSPAGWLNPPVWIPNVPSFFTFDTKDVYFFAEKREKVTVASMREIFSIGTTSWSTRAFLTSLPPSIQMLKNHQSVNMQTLKYFARHVQKIIVSAYDGEGYLVWSQTP